MDLWIHACSRVLTHPPSWQLSSCVCVRPLVPNVFILQRGLRSRNVVAKLQYFRPPLAEFALLAHEVVGLNELGVYLWQVSAAGQVASALVVLL